MTYKLGQRFVKNIAPTTSRHEGASIVVEVVALDVFHITTKCVQILGVVSNWTLGELAVIDKSGPSMTSWQYMSGQDKPV